MTVLLDKDRKEGKELVEMLETLPDSEKKQAAIYIGALYDRQLLAEMCIRDSLNVEFEPEFRPNAGGVVGIDVGIKAFYSDSNGNTVNNPKYLEKSMRKLIWEQRRLSRKQKGSNNRNKQRIKVALVHEQISNQRNDFLQKQSTMLVRENQTICIEDLKVRNMLRNHKLAQHIGSASWSKFFDMLIYKAAWYGNGIIKVPTFYPSSQTCSCCGYKNPLVKNLAVRKWECPGLSLIHI